MLAETFKKRVEAISENATWDEDNYGQIIIYTDLELSEDGKTLEPFSIRDDA